MKKMKKICINILFALILNLNFGFAQNHDLNYVLKIASVNESFQINEYSGFGTISKDHKYNLDIFLNDFKYVFEFIGTDYGKELISDEKIKSIYSDFSDGLVFPDLKSYLEKYPDDQFFNVVENIRNTSENPNDFLNSLNKLKLTNLNEEKFIYLINNIIFIIENSNIANNTDTARKSWWKRWGKCLASSVGGALTAGVGGCAGVGAVGGTIGAIGGPVGAAAGALGGCIGGGVVGAIGGALAGAALGCD